LRESNPAPRRVKVQTSLAVRPRVRMGSLSSLSQSGLDDLELSLWSDYEILY